MTRSAKALVALAAVIVICAPNGPASAISVELAKKCRALMLKSYPYELPGGRNGNSEAQREYFSKCVANDGNMPDEPAKTTKGGSGQTAEPANASKGGSGQTAAPANASKGGAGHDFQPTT